ncbi:MAG TPA: VCBS repeat-containing protein [Longimicrobium sp.]|nr:VCBS repeat-containing protein [Longimicrobium sp.]
MTLFVVGTACSGEDRAPDQTARTVAAESRTHPDSAAVAAVGERYAGATVALVEAAAVPGTAYRSGILSYHTPGRDDAYGYTAALWTAEDGRVLWTHDHRGDFRPHELVWLDVDADRDPDLFFTSGEEDVFQTYLFANRAGGSGAADSALSLAYRSGNDYTTLLDLDGDGAPELIDSGHAGEQHVETPACEEAPMPDAVKQAAAQEYARRVASFDRANFKYGMDAFAPLTLHLLDPVRILQVRDGQVRDATRGFAEHLRWRIGVLEQYRALADAGCRAHLDGVIRHLRGAAGAAP